MLFISTGYGTDAGVMPVLLRKAIMKCEALEKPQLSAMVSIFCEVVSSCCLAALRRTVCKKLMRCCRLVLLKLTHIVAGAERSALRQVLDGERLIRVIVRHIVGRVLNGDLEIAFFLFSEHEQNEQLVDRQGNNMRIGLVQVHRDHDAADTFLNLGIASGGQDEPVRIENKMCIGRAAAACKVEPAHADRCEGVIAVRFSAVKQNQAAGTGSACSPR